LFQKPSIVTYAYASDAAILFGLILLGDAESTVIETWMSGHLAFYYYDKDSKTN
jgi:hypothetical protein